MRLDDGASRERELYQGLERALVSEDAAVRYDALVFIRAHSETLDPRPLERALKQLDATEGDTGGQATIDQAVFARAGREEHRRTYLRAIEDGSAAIGKAASVDRMWAIEAACREGLDDLRSVIEKYYEQVPEQERIAHNWSLERATASLELRAGAASVADAEHRAVRRLSEMEPTELAAKLRESAGWRLASAEVLDRTCAKTDSPECQAAMIAIQRQRNLVAKASEGGGQAVAAVDPKIAEAETVIHKWLSERP